MTVAGIGWPASVAATAASLNWLAQSVSHILNNVSLVDDVFSAHRLMTSYDRMSWTMALIGQTTCAFYIGATLSTWLRSPTFNTLKLLGICGAWNVLNFIRKETLRSTTTSLLSGSEQHPSRDPDWAWCQIMAMKSRRPLETQATTRRLLKTPLPEVTLRSDTNAHAKAASQRLASTLFISAMLNNAPTHVYQPSNREIKHFNVAATTKFPYFSKDLIDPVSDVVYEGDKYGLPSVMMDVDYYVDDLQHILIKHRNRIFLYTFMLEEVAEDNPTNDGYTFSITNNVMKFTPSGAASYSHRLWDYCGETFTVHKGPSWFPYHMKLFSVDKVRTSKNRAVVVLTPIAEWTFPFSVITAWNTTHASLDRLRVSHEGVNILRVQKPDSDEIMANYVSIADEGSTVSTNIPVKLYSEMCSIVDNDAKRLNAHSVAKITQNLVDTPGLLANSIRKLRSRKIEFDTVVSPVNAIQNYSFTSHYPNEEKREQMLAYMSPILTPTFVPYDCTSSSARAIVSRIQTISPPFIKDNPRMSQYMHDFINLIRSDLVPVDQDEVWKRQPRPAQQIKLEHATTYDYVNPMEHSDQFLKAEGYPTFTDPRIISTVPDGYKLRYSLYMYAISDYVKDNRDLFPWYAFGKTPKEIAQRVADVCSNSLSVVTTDFSRYDGRISNVIRKFENLLLRALFPDSTEVCELHRQGFNSTSKLGIYTYDAGYARLSGSPETSILNTIVNAFISYCVYRSLGLDSSTAYDSLGVYGGDDGLSATPVNTPDKVFLKKMSDTAHALGQKMTTANVLRGQLGVAFLSRFYSDTVWYGNTASMCDLSKVLCKLHICGKQYAHIDPKTKLLDKLIGFFYSDRNTPVVGVLATQAYYLSPEHVQQDCVGMGFRSYMTVGVSFDDQYPQDLQNSDWMLEMASRMLPNSFFGRYESDVLSNIGSLDAMLKLPLLYDISEYVDMNPKNLPVEVNEEYVENNPPANAPSKREIRKEVGPALSHRYHEFMKKVDRKQLDDLNNREVFKTACLYWNTHQDVAIKQRCLSVLRLLREQSRPDVAPEDEEDFIDRAMRNGVARAARSSGRVSRHQRTRDERAKPGEVSARSRRTGGNNHPPQARAPKRRGETQAKSEPSLPYTGGAQPPAPPPPAGQRAEGRRSGGSQTKA